jgi:hypothetical protein
MKIWILRAILLLVIAAAGLYATRNYGGEIAVLYSTDSYGKSHRTDLWVVGDDSNLWIRATTPSSPWLDRIINNPEVELRRGTMMKRYRATPSTHRRDRVNATMAETYGWAEWLLAQVEDRSEAVPVYLDPFG